MKVIIREYNNTDYQFLVRCMNSMQQHISFIDPFKRSLLPPDFQPRQWVANIFKKIKKTKGAIFIAEHMGKPIGCVVGIIKQSTREDHLDTSPFKDGRIIELFVESAFRGKNIGALLTKRIEKFFLIKGCKFIQLGCLATNIGAYKFYIKHGYKDWNIDMWKKLR